MSEPKYAGWEVRYEMTVLPGTEFAFLEQVKLNDPFCLTGGVRMDRMLYRPAGKTAWCIAAPTTVDNRR